MGTNLKLEKISVTELASAIKCELKLFYKKTLPPTKKSPALAKGIVFHSVVAKILERGVFDGYLADFEQEWAKERENADFKGEEDKAKGECLGYIEIYKNAQNGLSDLLKRGGGLVEYHFNLKVGKKAVNCASGEVLEVDDSLKITGKIDLLTKDGWLIDHKTASKKWTQEEADKELQAHLYPLGMRSLGKQIKGFIFKVVSKKGVEDFVVEPKDEIFSNAINYAFGLQRHYPDNLTHTSKRFVCQMCEFRFVCKSSLIEDV